MLGLDYCFGYGYFRVMFMVWVMVMVTKQNPKLTLTKNPKLSPKHTRSLLYRFMIMTIIGVYSDYIWSCIMCSCGKRLSVCVITEKLRSTETSSSRKVSFYLKTNERNTKVANAGT